MKSDAQPRSGVIIRDSWGGNAPRRGPRLKASGFWKVGTLDVDANEGPGCGLSEEEAWRRGRRDIVAVAEFDEPLCQ